MSRDAPSQFDSKDRSANARTAPYIVRIMDVGRKRNGTSGLGALKAGNATRAGDIATEAACWKAIETRDAAFDGAFYYSVATTGVYCRPSCPSRRAKRENVNFHASCEAAETAGYRPCKRCRPDQPSLRDRYAAKMEHACRLIEAAEQPPKLHELARAASLSAFHFHRLFRTVVGVTPKAYAAAHRRGRLRDNLKQNNSVTEAIYAAGFNSSGRFYANSTELLGMTPSEFRGGGFNAAMRFAVEKCSLGFVLAAASDKGITAILLGDNAEALVRELKDRFPKAALVGGDRRFKQIMAKVVGLVEAPGAATELPLDVRGTAFQQRVWQALRKIPSGSTANYSEIAAQIGLPRSVRAVAGACAANKIAIAIPCHRVVRSDGALSGYRWGVERKRTLIEREAKRRPSSPQKGKSSA